MKDLTPLIDAVGTAHPQQIADFMKRHPREEFPLPGDLDCGARRYVMS